VPQDSVTLKSFVSDVGLLLTLIGMQIVILRENPRDKPEAQSFDPTKFGRWMESQNHPPDGLNSLAKDLVTKGAQLENLAYLTEFTEQTKRGKIEETSSFPRRQRLDYAAEATKLAERQNPNYARAYQNIREAITREKESLPPE
jgi:hypothetical protein